MSHTIASVLFFSLYFWMKYIYANKFQPGYNLIHLDYIRLFFLYIKDKDQRFIKLFGFTRQIYLYFISVTAPFQLFAGLK